jgi:hypothetical protein
MFIFLYFFNQMKHKYSQSITITCKQLQSMVDHGGLLRNQLCIAGSQQAGGLARLAFGILACKTRLAFMILLSKPNVQTKPTNCSCMFMFLGMKWKICLQTFNEITDAACLLPLFSIT